MYAITDISRRSPCNIAPKNSDAEHENPQNRLKIIKNKRIDSNAMIQNSRYTIYNMPRLIFFTDAKLSVFLQTKNTFRKPTWNKKVHCYSFNNQ